MKAMKMFFIISSLFATTAYGVAQDDMATAVMLERDNDNTHISIPDFGYFFVYNKQQPVKECTDKLSCEYYEDNDTSLEVCFKCERLVRVCKHFVNEGLTECSHFYRLKD